MTLQERIEAFAKLGERLQSPSPNFIDTLHRAADENTWFTLPHLLTAIDAITSEYLNASKLEQWVQHYHLPSKPSKSYCVGIVMAGNIPLAGFHDLLCVVICGHRAQVKLSSKDTILLPALLQMLFDIAPNMERYFQIVERLANFDAVIATGSNNSARYFHYYFGKYPNVIRHNRSSAAILDGSETPQDLNNLGKDIFTHFGLGCRNVTKLFVPQNYNFVFFLDQLEPYNNAMQHHKYKNNYDYQRSLLLLNRQAHFASDFLMLTENNDRIATPVSVLYYEYYESQNELEQKIQHYDEQIQCIVGNPAKKPYYIPFGKAQCPKLNDYSDKIDIVDFLMKLP